MMNQIGCDRIIYQTIDKEFGSNENNTVFVVYFRWDSLIRWKKNILILSESVVRFSSIFSLTILENTSLPVRMSESGEYIFPA